VCKNVIAKMRGQVESLQLQTKAIMETLDEL
jgi:hypothetical protein